jgi:hypothetical protein
VFADLKICPFTEVKIVPDPIRIESLIPQPLPGLRRVSLTLRVSGLPDYGLGAGHNLLQFHDMPTTPEEAQEAKPNQSPRAPNVDQFLYAPASNQGQAENSPAPGYNRSPSPYPDVTLSILDQSGNEIATTYIVEHKEPELDFTLHVRDPDPGAMYTARAELTTNDEVIRTVQVPFVLRQQA